MRNYVIIPLREIAAAYHSHAQAVSRCGIEPRGLIRYGILYASHRFLWTALNNPAVEEQESGNRDVNAALGGTYHELCGYLQRDIMSTCTNLLRGEVQQLMHLCMDHIQLIDQYVIPFVFAATGNSSTLRYERPVGHDSILVSVETPLI